jgi:prophage regulatory protein
MREKFPSSPPILLRVSQLQVLLTCCRSSVYVWMRREGFPRPVRLSRNAVAWYRVEVEQWLYSRERAGVRAYETFGVRHD